MSRLQHCRSLDQPDMADVHVELRFRYQSPFERAPGRQIQGDEEARFDMYVTDIGGVNVVVCVDVTYDQDDSLRRILEWPAAFRPDTELRRYVTAYESMPAPIMLER